MFNDNHLFEFELSGAVLNFHIDGDLVLSQTDHDLLWGTHGIRTDYCDVYVASIEITQ